MHHNDHGSMVKLSATVAALMAALAIAACGSDDESGPSGDATKVAYSNPVGAQPGQQDIVFGFDRRRRGARLDGGVDRREPVARQAGRRHRDDGHPGPGRHRQLDARPRRRRRRVRPGQGGRHPGRRRELRGHGHRRDGVVGDQPVRRRTRRSRTCTKYIAEERPGAKVLAIGGPPVPSIQAYEKCFAENAKRNGLTIVGKAHNTKDTAATAQPIVADLLTKTPTSTPSGPTTTPRRWARPPRSRRRERRSTTARATA